jgi:hypothetical protein
MGCCLTAKAKRGDVDYALGEALLKVAMDHPNATVRWSVMKAVSDLGRDFDWLYDHLIRGYMIDKDRSVRLSLIQELEGQTASVLQLRDRLQATKTSDPEAIASLTELLETRESRAIRVLGPLRTLTSSDVDPAVRDRALSAMISLR